MQEEEHKVLLVAVVVILFIENNIGRHVSDWNLWIYTCLCRHCLVKGRSRCSLKKKVCEKPSLQVLFRNRSTYSRKGLDNKHKHSGSAVLQERTHSDSNNKSSPGNTCQQCQLLGRTWLSSTACCQLYGTLCSTVRSHKRAQQTLSCRPPLKASC